MKIYSTFLIYVILPLIILLSSTYSTYSKDIMSKIDLPDKSTGIEVIEEDIPTDGGGVKGNLHLTIFKPAISGPLPTVILCPGSVEPASNWDFYFPPLTPQFFAKRGFMTVMWDPRGSFTMPPLGGALTLSNMLDTERYAVGESSSYPSAILMLSKYFVDDLEKVITYTYNELSQVDVKNIAVTGFSHGATYPLIEQVIYNDNRVKLIFAIEPMGDETSLIDMFLGLLPGVGPALVDITEDIPQSLYDTILWEPLYNGLGILGVATKYAAQISCPVFIIQSERYHASMSGTFNIAECKSPGLSMYAAITNSPFKKFNKEAANISVEEIKDFFPAPLWDDGQLLCDYFIEYIEPMLK
jgi:pimeloyl-ACP methyl ester carboxylesterase